MKQSPGQHIIPLSSIDHIFTGVGSYPIEFIFCYREFLDEESMKSSLERILQFFPVISSVLISTSEDAYAFEESSEGLVFDVVRSEILFDKNDNKYEYINPVETLEGNPLTKIRITHTPEGSVLGVSISHAIADGFSYFHFLSSWARQYHEQSFLPPVHRRDLLLPKDIPVSKDPNPKTVLTHAGLFLNGKREAIAKHDLNWESRLFDYEVLKNLLSEAQTESDMRLSFNDIVTAQLAKEFLLKWEVRNGSRNCYISCPVDFRRIMEDFPKTYFGNAVVLATTGLTYGELKSITVADLAIRIRTNVKSVNKNSIINSLETLTALRHQQKRRIFEKVHVMHPIDGLLVTNLSRLPVQEIEFNCGPPVKFSILTQTVRGAVVLPHIDGLEVRVCCPI